MKKHYLLLLFSTLISFSQGKINPTKKYSKLELITFVDIYKFALNNPFEPLVSMQKNASKINISEERLTEIIQNQFADNNIVLSDTEKIELEKLKILIQEEKDIHDLKIENYALTKKMDFSKYKQMEKLYYENSKFQKKVNKLFPK